MRPEVAPAAEMRGGGAGCSHVPSTDKRRGRMPALDGFRGCAVLAVFFYHFSLPILAANPHGVMTRFVLHVLLSGSVGVDMFFALSGFLITGILLDVRGTPHYFRNFYARRVLRIFPLYYLVLTIAFVGFGWTNAIRPFVPHQAWLWLYVANFAALRHVSFVPMFDHFWSLAVEEQFYLAWPLIVFLLPKRRLMALSIALIGASLIVRCGLIHRGMDAEIAASLTPCRLEGLLLGSLLAMLARSPAELANLRRPAIVVGLVAAAAAFASRALAAPGGMWGLSGVGHFTVPLAFTCVMALAAGGRGMWSAVLSMQWLRFFGKYSYGIYVFHYMFEPWLDKWFWYLPAFPLASILLHLVMALAATLAVAMVSWHLYEKQILKLNRPFDSHASPRQTTPPPQSVDFKRIGTNSQRNRAA
jgi:peptidoglycan/LPS O-acetylase OafA/YrhL